MDIFRMLEPYMLAHIVLPLETLSASAHWTIELFNLHCVNIVYVSLQVSLVTEQLVTTTVKTQLLPMTTPGVFAIMLVSGVSLQRLKNYE